MAKLESALLSALSKVDKLEIKGAPRLMVYFFVAVVAAALLLFVGAWVAAWAQKGTADLSIMIQFINSVTSVSFIAAVGFFGRAMIDSNGDGTPDEFDSKDRKETAMKGEADVSFPRGSHRRQFERR